MKKKEEKILEELRNKVFEKDDNIKQWHDEEELNKATKEVLTEMTELSLNEINDLEKNVRFEFHKKRKRIISVLIFIFILAVIASSLLFYYLGPYQFNDKLIFTENFDNNINAWETYNDYSYKRYFEDGKYIFTSNKQDSCYDDALSLILPKQFTAEITTTWIKGQYDAYGPKFILTYDGYSWFLRLQPKNKTSPYRNTSYYDPDWIIHKEDPNHNLHQHTQKVTFKPRPWAGDPFVRTVEMIYYINEEQIKHTNFDDLSTYNKDNDIDLNSEFLISVCGCQTVSFDHLKLKDDRTGRIIFEGSFEALKDRFHPGMKVKTFSNIENGTYIFTTDDKGQCYKSLQKLELKKHSKLNLISRWMKGENYYYGLILEQDDDNYYAFELRSDGKACFILRRDGTNEIFIDNLETGLSGTNNKTVVQTVFLKGNMLEYYVNGKLVLKEKHQLNPLNSFGPRVCGSQTVAFEKLEVWE